MAYAVHTMMSMNKSNAASKPQVAADTTASVTPAPAAATPSALPAAPTLGGAATPTASATGALSTNLINAVQPPADSGQLQSFSLFESKDPLHSNGPSSSGGGTSSGGSSCGTTSKPPKSPPAPPTAPPTSAVISVNGVSESVTAGGNFPAANPLFQLVSVSASV